MLGGDPPLDGKQQRRPANPGILAMAGAAIREAMADRKALEKKLIELRTEHRDLDEAIAALGATRPHDPLKIQRLKKRKLGLKDRINRIESELYPDIIA